MPANAQPQRRLLGGGSWRQRAQRTPPRKEELAQDRSVEALNRATGVPGG